MFSRFVLLIICFCCVSVSARICKSMDIRSHVSQFDKLKNCTKVVGFLKLVLLEDVTQYPSFPELTEITGYLLLFVVTGLVDVGRIFPNLIVIRGNILLEGNSLVIHHNSQIKQIGLSSLREIQRGHVHIGKCPNLCYVHTVNWTALGTSLSTYADIPKCKNEECAPDCQGQCWAPGKCQRYFNNCHPECLGCSQPSSPKDCLVCKNLKNVDTCVSNCPLNKFISDEILECVTEQECINMVLPGDRWIFDQWCIPVNTCPGKYEFVNGTCKPCIGGCNKICKGASIETKEHIELLKGCTYIDGHLEFRIKDVHVLEELAESLGGIREIDGCLKVARSDAITSLQFMKNLRRIGGRDKQKQCNNHTVFIYENANLKKLIDAERIETSKDVAIGFHDNPELCLSEIQNFATTLGISKTDFNEILRQAKDVSPYSNGDNAACANLRLNIQVTEINPTNITLKWTPYVAQNVTVIGYTIFYILASTLPKEGCDDVSSNMCNDNGWISRFISNSSIQLTQLAPFSSYVYWIKVYHIKVDNMSGVAGSTEKKTFTTLSDDPSTPLSFETVAISSSAINITWDSPEFPNGNLSYYQLIAFIEKDDPKFVSRRNYCMYPHVETPARRKSKKQLKKWLSQTENGTCVCETKIFKMDDTFCGPSSPLQSFSNEDCNKYMYQIIGKKRTTKFLLDHESDEKIFQGENNKRTTKRHLLGGESGPRIQPDKTVIDIKVPANETSYILKNLKHFTPYIILFSACNEQSGKKPQCSAVLFSAERTRANASADQVTNLNLKFLKDYDVSLSWEDSSNTNGLLVAYNIEYKSIDSSSSVYVPDCVTRNQHVKNNFIYRIEDLDPGLYAIRVRPVSLHGPGLYSRTITFQIKSPLKMWVIYLFVCIVFVIFTVVVIIYLWYKKKKSFDGVHLITSINPDYESVVYIEDSWEMSRDDVEINEVLGQGSFGLVLSGYIKSKKMSCAVKTLNRTVTMSYRTEFLNEASVMKKFSQAHHVVRLYGVVSRGEPPLVIMELMERGDLKEFLRNSRESSQAISSKEMYLMAAQIADGMAYLAARKFVHRDLAARNCMVAADRTVKIGDFGMTKDIYETDYYRQGTKGLLPVRWMAPESLADGIYSSESDVFGYGVVLWEMVTLAEQPYQGLSNEEVVDFVISNGRLGRPFGCPDILWEIMEASWITKSKKRPLFSGIVQKLEHLVGPSFSLVSFYHSQQGCEYRQNFRTDDVDPRRCGIDSYNNHSCMSQEDDMLMPNDEDLHMSSKQAF